MTNLVRAARAILLAVGELPPNKKLIHAAFALREALAEQALQKLSDFHQSIEQADEEGKTTDYMLGFSDGKNYAHKYEQAEREHDGHWSDCSVHNEPAYPNGPCDCGGYPPKHWRCACGANLYIDSNGAPASKAEQAEQEPVTRNALITCIAGAISKHMTVSLFPKEVFAAAEEIADNYAVPVRTKDLTDEEIRDIATVMNVHIHYKELCLMRAAIAADREKNRG